MHKIRLAPLDAIFIKNPKLKRITAGIVAMSIFVSLAVVVSSGYAEETGYAIDPTDSVRLEKDINRALSDAWMGGGLLPIIAEEQIAAVAAETQALADAQYQDELLQQVDNLNDYIDQTQAEEYVDIFTSNIEKSNVCINEGAYDKAQEYVDACKELDMTDAQYAIYLVQNGNIAYGIEDYKTATDYYRQTIFVNQEIFEVADVYFMVARCEVLLGDAESAITDCNAGIESLTDDNLGSELYVLRGTAYMSLGDYELANVDFKTAIEKGYSDVQILEDQIEACQQIIDSSVQVGTSSSEISEDQSLSIEAISFYAAGQYEKAAEAYRKLIGTTNSGYTQAQIYSCIAKCNLFIGEYDLAVEDCLEGIALNDTTEENILRALLGTAYMALGENVSAAQEFEQSINLGYTAPAELQAQIAACYYYANYFNDSINAAIQTIELNGGADNEVVVWGALSYYQIEDYQNATEWLERALKVDQDYCEQAELRRCLARSYLLLGEYDQVVNVTDTALSGNDGITADNQSTSDTYALRGASYMSSGQYQEAINDFYSAIAMGYSDPYELYKQCVLCSFILSDFESAISNGERALDISEGESDLYYWMGISYFTTGDYDKSYLMLSSAESLDESLNNLHFYMGVCKFSESEYELAIEHFTTSIEKGETVEKCTYNRALCYLQIEKYDEAKLDLEASINQTNEPSVASDAQSLVDTLGDLLE